MEENIIQKEADALLQEPVKLTVDVIPQSRWQRFLQSRNWAPRKKVFYVQPLVAGSLARITKILSDFDIKVFEQGATAQATLELVYQNAPKMAEIVAIAVTNTEKQPPKELVNFFLYQLSSKELKAVVNIVLKQMDVQSFLVATISAKNLSMIEVNPKAS